MSLRPISNTKAKSANSLLAGLLLVGLCLFGVGCDMKLPPMPWDPPAKPAADATAEGEGEGEDSGASEPPAPVNELDFLPPSMKKLPFEEVSIPLKDGLIIYGRLYDPKLKPESDEDTAPEEEPAADEEAGYKGPKYPLVILLHGLDRDHTTWSDLPASLVKAGYSVFAMDLRGHGKSTSTVHKRRVTWRLFQPEHWQQLSKDVDEVIEFFQKNEDHPEVDGKTVALMGAKLGANVAVFTARDMHSAVKAIVLISPGLDYKGIIPSQAIIDYTNPALLITTQDDPYSYKSTERLYNWLLGLKSMQVYKKIGDGTDMLSHQSALGENMTEWLVNQMPSPERPKAAPPPAEIKPEGQAEGGEEETKPAEDHAAAETPANPAEGKAPAPEKKVEPKKAEQKAKPKTPAKPAKKPIKKSKPKPRPAKTSTPKPAETKKTESPSAGQPPIPGG